MANLLIATVVNVGIQTALAYLFPSNTRQQGPRLDDLGVVGSSYGTGIPILQGRDRVPGNIVWALPLREEVNTDRQSAGKGSTVTTSTYQYFGSFGALQCAGDADLRPLRIWGDKKLLWEAPDTSLHLTGDLAGGGTFEFMPGSASQARSAVMEAALGTADCPAYRGRCLVVVADLPVEQFGRRIPIVEVEMANGVYNVNAVVADVLEDLCTRAGMDAGALDLSEVANEVHGVRLMPGAAAGMIDTLLTGLSLQAVSSGTTLAFRPVEQSVAASIDEGELLAGSDGRFPTTRLREDELPRSVSINYIDPDRDYQAGTQIQQRQAVRSVQASVIDAPMALSAAQAFGAIDALLYRAWTARVQYGPFGLPRKYLYLEPGDVVEITVDSVVHAVRLRSISIGANGALECTGEAYDAAVLTGATGGGSGDFPGQGLPNYGDTTLRLLDVPALTDAEAGQVGYRLAATGSGAAWRSGVLEVSVDDGTTWTTAATLLAYTTMGFAGTTPLPAPPAHIGAGNFDVISTVDVSIVKGTLASVSDELLLAGANRAMVGDEMIQFGTATLISPGNYTLSRLLRGRRGTEGAMAGHGADEDFTLLAGAPFVAASVADIGTPLQFRVTPSGGETSTPIAFTLAGASARPFSPVALAGSRALGDLTITWLRRSRIGTELPDSGDIPLDEPSQRYEVDIYNGASVVRTIAVTTASATYTAAEQTADFGSPQSAIDVVVYQIGQLVGRGTGQAATL